MDLGQSSKLVDLLTIKMASNFPSTSDPGPSEVFSNSSGDESDFTPPDPVEQLAVFLHVLTVECNVQLQAKHLSQL